MSKTLQLKVITALQDRLSGPLQKIRGAGGQSAQSMQQLREKLKGLENTQKAVSQFRDLSRGVDQTKTSMQAAQARTDSLARRLKDTAQPTAALRKEFTQATNASRRLKDEHQMQSQQLQSLRSRLSAAGVSTKNLTNDERGLRDRITQTNAALDQQKTKLGQVAQQQRQLAAAKEKYQGSMQMAGSMAGAGAAGMAAGGGVLYAGARMMGAGVQFDADMSQVQALTRLEKGNEKLVALRDQARQLGADTMFSATEAAQGQGYLAMAGFNPDAILGAMPGMLDLAKAGGNGLAETADIASNILTGFGINANEMGRVGDVLVGAFTRSNVNLAMLGETMKYAAPIASSLGQDIETVAGMTGKLGDAGIQGGQAGTALRSIMDRLSAPSKAAAKAIDTLGLKVSDAQGNMRPMPELLTEIYERTKGMGDTERAGLLKALAGEEAVSAMQILVKDAGSGDLQDFIKTLREAQGEAQATAKVMGDNLVGDLDELSSAWDDLGIELQEQQDGPMRDTVKMLADLVGGVKTWVSENPALVSTLVKVVAVLAMLVAAGGAVTLTIASILGPFAMLRYGMTMLGIKSGGLIRVFGMLGRTILPMVGKALLFVGKALFMNPIGLAVMGIAAVAYAIYRFWEPITKWVSEVWDSVSKSFSSGVESTKNIIGTVWASIAETAAAVWVSVTETISTVWGSIVGVGSRIWAEVKAAFDGGIESVAELIVNWSPLGLFYKAFAGVVSYLGVDLPAKFTDFGSMMMSGLINSIKTMGGAVNAFFGGLWSEIKTAFDGGIGGVMALLANWSPIGLIYKAFAAVMEYLGVELPGKFTDFGSMMMAGLVNGIKNMGSAVKDSIVGVGESAVGWFKDKLGIESPSRVFMALGANVSEGAALGISRRTSMATSAAAALAAGVVTAGTLAPLSVSAMPELSFDKRPALASFGEKQAGRGGIGSGPTALSQAGDHIEIHIHAAPGMATQDIAQAVAAELDKRERMRAARARSSLSDYGR